MSSEIEHIRSEVESWFSRVKDAGLVLPGGWYGRPYDNWHQLTYLQARPYQLLLELDSQLLLVFTQPTVVSAEEMILSIEGFSLCVFDGLGFVDLKPVLKTFDEGAVRFVVLSARTGDFIDRHGALIK